MGFQAISWKIQCKTHEIQSYDPSLTWGKGADIIVYFKSKALVSCDFNKKKRYKGQSESRTHLG